MCDEITKLLIKTLEEEVELLRKMLDLQKSLNQDLKNELNEYKKTIDDILKRQIHGL
jgi:hypothetical protein